MTKFERLKELEKRINRLERFLEKKDSYPVLLLSTRYTYSDDFYDQDETSKRLRGFPQTYDLPEDLNLRGLVIKRIEEQLAEYKKEFLKLLD